MRRICEELIDFQKIHQDEMRKIVFQNYTIFIKYDTFSSPLDHGMVEAVVLVVSVRARTGEHCFKHDYGNSVAWSNFGAQALETGVGQQKSTLLRNFKG